MWSMAYKQAVNSAVTVGTSSTEVLPAKGRIYAIIRNASNNDVWLAFGTAATASSGVLLKPDEFVEFGVLNPFYGAVYGIATANSLVVTVDS